MFSLPPPEQDDRAHYKTCLRRRRGRGVRSLLSALVAEVDKAYDTYRSVRGNPGKLSPLPCSEESKAALRANYELLSGKSSLGALRATLMSPNQGELDTSWVLQKCPMCGHAAVSTLDHYLPKSLFPEFSILSINLVPACSECNRLKSDLYSEKAGQRFLHAYFDVLPPKHQVLFASVNVTNERVGIHFELRKPRAVSDELFQVLQFHFQQLHLNQLFLKEAIAEIGDRFEAFQTAFLKGKEGLRRYLRGEADSVQTHRGVHYWKAALLRGLQESDSFCDGGFKLMAHRIGRSRNDS